MVLGSRRSRAVPASSSADTAPDSDSYEVDRTAWLITLATAHGCVIIDR